MKLLSFFIFLPIIFAALAFPFLIIWNNVMPEVFDLKSISYWQAFLLLVLLRIFIFPLPSFLNEKQD